jgi:hypothetical protein
MARRRKKVAGSSTKKSASKSTKRSTGRALRRLSDSFEERRFAPAAGTRDYIWVVLTSLGGIGLGVGAYAIFLRDDSLPPAPWTNYVLAAGVTLVAAYFLLGRSAQRPIRVGELGVAFEDEDKVSRVAWWQITSVDLDAGALRLKTKGKTHTIPVADNAAAVRRILREAMKRIPNRVEVDEARIEGLPASGEKGELLKAEPPQITGMECRSSSQALTFEKDVRLCGRCGVPYHKAGVPPRCPECGRRLRKA